MYTCGLSTGEVLEIKEAQPKLFKIMAILETVLQKHCMTLGEFNHEDFRYDLDKNKA